MSVTAPTIWRIRQSGSENNGGGFDPTVTSPGTDWSQQDAAQVTLDGATIAMTSSGASATVTVTGRATLATDNGNVVNITGGTNFIVGRFVITSVSVGVAGVGTWTFNANVTSGVGAAGAGYMGGGLTLPNRNYQVTQPVIVAALVAGNTVYVRGGGTNVNMDYTTAPDYTWTGYIDLSTNPGTLLSPINWISENGRARLQSNGATIWYSRYHSFTGLYFVISSNLNTSSGMFYCDGSGISRFYNCVFNLNNQAGSIAVNFAVGQGHVLVQCDIYGGTASPTASGGSYGLYISSAYLCGVVGNTIHNCRGPGIHGGTNYNYYVLNIISGNQGDGIIMDTLGGGAINNTIDNNTGNGLNLSGSAQITLTEICNNIITNHTGSGKSGISVSGTGTAAQNMARAMLCNYNDLFNNTSNYSGINAGSHDLSIDPQYTSATDWTPKNTALLSAFPGQFQGAASVSYEYIGAITPNQSGGGGGGGTANNSTFLRPGVIF